MAGREVTEKVYGLKFGIKKLIRQKVPINTPQLALRKTHIPSFLRFKLDISVKKLAESRKQSLYIATNAHKTILIRG